MRDLEPSVQTFVFQRFLARVQNANQNNEVNPPECFILASFYINQYGADSNHAEAIRLILHAAKWGHPISKAYNYRICSGLEEGFRADDQMISNLWDMALEGSRMAFQDLAHVAPQKYSQVRNILRDGLAGTGARFFEAQTGLLHGFSFGQWMDTFDNQEVLIQNFSRLNRIADYRINKRGDGILHMAASCGKCKAIEALLDSFSALDVNQVNDQGETPLLCACRAGQTEVVHLLLARGADVSIVTPSKESPIHWLLSFDDADIEIVGASLLASGADIRLRTTKLLAYSRFPSGIELDHQQPGTPLSWAVHHDRPVIVKFLLDHAETAAISIDTVAPYPTPIQWAAHYHHVECLKLMIEAMREEKLGFTYTTFLESATRSADVFSMMLRHGPRYKVKLKETFDYLLRATFGTTFSTGLGGFGSTLLYLAVSEAHDAVVEYLLSPEVEALLAEGQAQHNSKVSDPTDQWSRRYGVFSREHINQPCGVDKQTPLLECVRWNRKGMFRLLVENGADVCVTARNPFTKDQMEWSALHIFAHAGHNVDVTLAADLVAAGVPVNGRLTPSSMAETPILVALENNAFNLATTLLGLGADINALSLSSGLMSLEHPNTILGHIVASAAQHSRPRLRYLLSQCDGSANVEFIVESERKISALHRAAWAYHGISSRSADSDDTNPIQRKDYDMDINRDIMYELLQRFNSPEQLNVKSGYLGRTALHLAVEVANLAAVEFLLERGADTHIQDDLEQTALELGQHTAVHYGIKCDGCGGNPLRGIRWHCRTCPDHDLCDTCKKASQSPDHSFQATGLKERFKHIAAVHGVSRTGLNHIHGSKEMESLVLILDLLESESLGTGDVGVAELRDLHIG
jgi:ankyrin repeat protein